VEALIGGLSLRCFEWMISHVLERGTEKDEMIICASLRRERRRARLDQFPQFEQTADELRLRRALEGPCKDVGIEHIPPAARIDSCPCFWPALNQTLCCQDAHRLAISRSRDPELPARCDFSSEMEAGRAHPAYNLDAYRSGDRAVNARWHTPLLVQRSRSGFAWLRHTRPQRIPRIV